MKVLFCCGMSRSGGTLQYQIVSETVARLELGRGIGFGIGLGVGKYDEEQGWLVCKKEPPESWALEMCDMAIGTHRDPRDVVYSFMRWRGEQGKGGDFASALDETLLATRWFSRWEPHCNYIARYDAFDSVEQARVTAKLLGHTLSKTDAQDIAHKFSIGKNRERMARIAAQGDWMNPSLMLTRAHIGSEGGQSVWRERLTQEQIAEVEDLLGAWMEEHGYSVLDSGQ
jgi:hypothetical protein